MNSYRLSLFLAVAMLIILGACQTQRPDSKAVEDISRFTHIYGDDGNKFTVQLVPGKYHNYPTFALWVEDVYGNLIQTVFVTKSIASGYFKYGDAGDGKWLKVPGEAHRPAALPYWLHKRETFGAERTPVPTVASPFPDAYTGATPPARAKIEVGTKETLPDQFRIVLEVNQPWDWNNYWTNDKYPGNLNYRTSAQPSLVYAANVSLSDGQTTYYLNPIGHGHYDGSDGKLYTNLGTITSALGIFERIIVEFK